ncbi:MAG: ribonuclease P protein component [Deltaproteobacteria bacterium]|nr:ribonuclease P protein component [Deltaproteobacteria bacterium]
MAVGPEPNLKATGRFERSRRLLVRREFLRVQGRGIRIEGRHFVVVSLKGEADQGSARLGLSIGKRVGGAVIRNRLKRLIREAFRRMNEMPGVDVVVIAKTSAAALAREGFEALVRELLPAIERAARRAEARP